MECVRRGLRRTADWWGWPFVIGWTWVKDIWHKIVRYKGLFLRFTKYSIRIFYVKNCPQLKNCPKFKKKYMVVVKFNYFNSISIPLYQLSSALAKWPSRPVSVILSHAFGLVLMDIKMDLTHSGGVRSVHPNGNHSWWIMCPYCVAAESFVMPK